MPVAVSHLLEQLPQVSGLVFELSQPLVFGAVVSQSRRFPAQTYEHLLPSQAGVPVAESHLVEQFPHVSTLLLLLSQPSVFGAIPALQSRVALLHA